MSTQSNKTWRILFTLVFMQLSFTLSVYAQSKTTASGNSGLFIFLFLFVFIVLGIAISMSVKTEEMVKKNKRAKVTGKEDDLSTYLQNLDSQQIEILLKKKRQTSKDNDKQSSAGSMIKSAFLLIVSLLTTAVLFAQNNNGQPETLLSEKGVIITVILILSPILIGVLLMFLKVRRLFDQFRVKRNLADADKLADYISSLNNDEIMALEKRKAALDYQLSHSELSGSEDAADEKGMISNAGTARELTFVSIKKKAVKRPNIDRQLAKLILWYIGTATFWLLFGTTIGEYLGIKFVSPDADHISWLSFGRLRPVHTNAVFWGWVYGTYRP